MNVVIISGSYGHNVDGLIRVIRPGGMVDLPDDEAKRLIEIGVAETPYPIEAETPEDLKSPDGMLVGTLDPELLEGMDFSVLKQLATDMGLPAGKLRSRENITKAILEQKVSVPEDEEVPDLTAEDPVV